MRSSIIIEKELHILYVNDILMQILVICEPPAAHLVSTWFTQWPSRSVVYYTIQYIKVVLCVGSSLVRDNPGQKSRGAYLLDPPSLYQPRRLGILGEGCEGQVAQAKAAGPSGGLCQEGCTKSIRTASQAALYRPLPAAGCPPVHCSSGAVPSIKGCLLCYEKRKAAVLPRATPRRPRRSTRGPPPTSSHNVKVAPLPYSMRRDCGGFPQ